ncbi:MAG: hypothetical protein JSU00_14155 [Acidobacteria bacterium]|nr:hypothetical protein [Acidobacteriota bacterium]
MKALLLAAAACSAAAFAAETPLPRCDVAPGWTQAGAARMYEGDNLYDYMDGNSEGYLIYGFQKMHGVTCKKGETQFVVDVSDFPDPEMAYGMYASNRDPRMPVEALGMSGQIVPQRGIFVKGSKFAEISASPTSLDHSAEIRKFLQALEAKLDGTRDQPEALGWFPKEGLDGGTIRLIPQSVLGLSILKRGYLAKYDYGRAFIVKQPTGADQVIAKLKARFAEVQPISIGDEGFQATDKYLGRLIVFRKGAYVAGFANLKDGFDGAPAAKALAAGIR